MLTVLGGSSPGTRVLLSALHDAFAAGTLSPFPIRLWARDAERLRAVVETSPVDVQAMVDLSRALDGASVVLCQVRPGGQAGRAADERLAIRAGVPGDEGLGPSGLACYLRSKPMMDGLFSAISRHAPTATLLMLTSPLGLWVARAVQVHGLPCLGVCELPTTTARRVRTFAEPALGPLQVDHLGLNHQGWLHRFTDAAGRDRTQDVLERLPADGSFQVDPEIIRDEGAIPLPYLGLYHHPERALARQRAAEPRGELLARWQDRLEATRDPARQAAVLAERAMDWYREGVLPALVALERGGQVPLTLPAGSLVPGLPPETVVELPCWLDRTGARPRPVPPLPPGPDRLFRRLVAWERATLALPDAPCRAALRTLLEAHPLVPDAATAEKIATELII